MSHPAKAVLRSLSGKPQLALIQIKVYRKRKGDFRC